MAIFSKFFKIATVAAAVAGPLALSTPAFAGPCGGGGPGGGFGGRGFGGHCFAVRGFGGHGGYVGYGGWGWGWDDPSYYTCWGPYYGGPHYGDDYPVVRRVNVRLVHRAHRSCIGRRVHVHTRYGQR